MKPIIFSTEMVRAILDGQKTQMRRVMKHQPVGEVRQDSAGNYGEDYGGGITYLKPPYKPGNVLYVKEAFTDTMMTIRPEYLYKADPIFDDCAQCDLGWDWSSAHFMPRQAARIFLKVTSVKAERLNDISADDAKAEGSYLDRCECLPRSKDKTPIDKLMVLTNCHIHGHEFKHIWNSTYAKHLEYSWEKNPWVWVIRFEITEAGK